MPITATSAARLNSIADVRAAVAKARQENARIGFVPTMGALHQGHISLVERARREADIVVMSIFVNPLQFGPGEDFSRYPRSLDNDSQLATEAAVDFLFAPSPAEMYDRDPVVTLSAGEIGKTWEGEVRPGHFDGVLTVVGKLFNIVQPDLAVFGRKDLQQAALIKAMVRDLDFPVSIVIAPTVRESDGLALSSRNSYLSVDDRVNALVLVRALRATAASFDRGERDARRLEETGKAVFAGVPSAKLDYFAVVDADTFERESLAKAGSAVIVAARLGATRLIDNIILGDHDQD